MKKLFIFLVKMAKTRHCNQIRYKIIEEFRSGTKQSAIARMLKIPTSTVFDIIKKFRSGKSVEADHFGGRPRKTSVKTDRRIKNFALKDPFATSKTICEELNLPISTSTVRKRLKDIGLDSFRPAKKPLLTSKHRRKR